MRQVRITISDEAWAEVSAAAARRHMDRGALIDEVLRDPDATDSHFYINRRVVTNVGPDQQDQAHELARQHAQAVAAAVEEERDGHS